MNKSLNLLIKNISNNQGLKQEKSSNYIKERSKLYFGP